MKVLFSRKNALLIGIVLCYVMVFFYGCFAIAEENVSEQPEDRLTRQCLECGNGIPTKDQYCGSCGTEVGHWKCTNCGRTNSEEDIYCIYCSEKRHESGKGSMNETNEKGAFWICVNCQARNSFDDHYCPECGKTQSCVECGISVLIEDKYCGSCGTEVGYWKCMTCGKTNSERDNYCIYCADKRHKPRQVSATETGETGSYWICVNCEAQNSVDYHYCPECGETQCCFECGASVPKNDKNCRNCGADLEYWKCYNCGNINMGINIFCSNCGAKRYEPGYQITRTAKK